VPDEFADRVVAARPPWARTLFGEQPEQYQRADHWDRGIRDAARYRIQHAISDDTAGLGPESAGDDAGRDSRQTQRVLEQTQRRLGIAGEHDQGLGRGTWM
jgi:hypothetical protein